MIHSCESSEEYTPFHAISSFSSTALDLPSSPESIARRFNALVITYGVEFVDHKVSQSYLFSSSNSTHIKAFTFQTRTTRPGTASSTENEMERKDTVEGDDPFNKPCWNLMTRGSYDW